MTTIAFSNAIGPVPVDVRMRERLSRQVSVTANPVEVGADVTDHAFLEPQTATLEIAAANAAATWQALKALQDSRVPFTLVTGLDVLPNMLITGMDSDREAATGNILSGVVELRELILVSTAQASSSGGASTAPQGQEAGQTDATRPGNPGGDRSTNASRPTPATTSGTTTTQRASPTVVRGDSPTTTVTPSAPRNQSILNRIFA